MSRSAMSISCRKALRQLEETTDPGPAGGGRRAAGYCFKCRVSDVKDLPFLECPLHGALAFDPNPPTVGRKPAQKRG